MRRWNAIVCASLFVVALLAGCAGDINPERQLSDAVLSANVTDALNADRDLSRYDLVVDSNGGVITLLGEVPSSTLSSRAESIASRVEGVKSVINQIRITN